MDDVETGQEILRGAAKSAGGGLAAVGNYHSGMVGSGLNYIPRPKCEDNACEVHGKKAKAKAQRTARKLARQQLEQERAALIGGMVQALANGGGYAQAMDILVDDAIRAVDELQRRLDILKRVRRHTAGMIAHGGPCSTEAKARSEQEAQMRERYLKERHAEMERAMIDAKEAAARGDLNARALIKEVRSL